MLDIERIYNNSGTMDMVTPRSLGINNVESLDNQDVPQKDFKVDPLRIGNLASYLLNLSQHRIFQEAICILPTFGG